MLVPSSTPYNTEYVPYSIYTKLNKCGLRGSSTVRNTPEGLITALIDICLLQNERIKDLEDKINSNVQEELE